MREKETEVTAVNRKREDVGVELYGTQQQLARLQEVEGDRVDGPFPADA